MWEATSPLGIASHLDGDQIYVMPNGRGGFTVFYFSKQNNHHEPIYQSRSLLDAIDFVKHFVAVQNEAERHYHFDIVGLTAFSPFA